MYSKLLLIVFLATSIGIKGQHYAFYSDMSPSSSKALLEARTGGGGTEYTSTYPSVYLQHHIKPAFTYVFEIWDGKKWFELNKVVLKGTTTRLVIWGDRIICTGRITSFDNKNAPIGKYFGMIEYKNNQWDTMKGGTFDSTFNFGNVCATKENLYFATYKDSNFIHHTRIYKYDEASGIFGRVADLQASWSAQYRIIAGKSKLLFSGIHTANGNPAIGFAYLNANDSVIRNTDSAFSAFTIYGIDGTDDHIYGVQEQFENQVLRYKILEFSDQLLQIRYTNTLPGSSYLNRIQVWKGNILWYWTTSDFKIRYYYTLCKGDTIWNVLKKDFTGGSGWFGPLVSRHGAVIQDFDNNKMLQLQVGSGAHVQGTAYIDMDSNCNYNASIDKVLPYYRITMKNNGNAYISFSDKDGLFKYFAAKGQYSMSDEKQSPACFNGMFTISKDSTYRFDVPVKGPSKYDYSVQPIQGNNIRWNSNFIYTANIKNKGFPSDSSYFVFHIDPRITIDSCSLPQADIDINTATGKVYNLNYNDIRQIHFYCRMDTSQLKPDSMVYSSFVSRLYKPEPDSTDNRSEMKHLISYSFDPNHKDCNLQKIPIMSRVKLDYFIEFQNEGNDDAYDVVLIDTLSDAYDIQTLSIDGYSHPVSIKLSGSILTATFSNIFLKPMKENVDASIGYLKFSISTKDNLPKGHTISNTAYIYFDLNKPVITAPAITLVEDPEASGISALPLSSLLYPNPSSGIFTVKFNNPNASGFEIVVYDCTGKTVLQKSGDTESSDMQINLTPCAKGIYTAQITVEGVTRYAKLIKY